jgi:Protein adenylyltransferase SelO
MSTYKDIQFLSSERMIDYLTCDSLTSNTARVAVVKAKDKQDHHRPAKSIHDAREVDGFYALAPIKPLIVTLPNPGTVCLYRFQACMYNDLRRLHQLLHRSKSFGSFVWCEVSCKHSSVRMELQRSSVRRLYTKMTLDTPQLGGGRCLSTGEFVTSTGKRFELQLKGTGPNCFSRGGDGLCLLSACLTECLLAEYANAIGIPSTRCLAVAGGAPNVWRKGIKEKQGMLTRFAPTWVRFGTFELFFYRNQTERLRELADFLIKFHFQDAKEGYYFKTTSLLPSHIFKREQDGLEGGALVPNPEYKNEPVSVIVNSYGALFRLIVLKTAVMVAHWQAQGFVHGLLNTDHISVLGITMHTPHGVSDYNIGIYGRI